MRCEFSIMSPGSKKERTMLLLISNLILGALLSSMLGVTGCSMVDRDTIRGSGVAKTETRDVAEFTKVESTGSPDVTITIGDKQSLSIEADDNILPVLTTEVKEGKLTIGSSEGYSPRTDIKITITVRALDGAAVSGSGEIAVTGLKATAFEAAVTGSGEIKLEGEADSLAATVTGSGDLDATKLTVADATVRVTGSGDAKVNATKSLIANVTGSGDVRYSGNPGDVTEQVQGSGSVRKL
jgi:hypothetical protein